MRDAAAEIELGRRLFFDPAASRLGRHACAECHRPEHGFSDPRRVSDDDFGPTERHSQTLVDVGLTSSAHWDGQLADVRDLVRSRLGVGSRVGIYNEGSAKFLAAALKTLRATATAPLAPEEEARRLRAVGDVLRSRRMDLVGLAARYREALEAARGTRGATADTIAEAIHAYCGSIRSGESAYDRFAAGDDAALSPLARRGFLLFTGRAGCVVCHAMAGARARFTDDRFHDTGVAWRSVKAGTSPAPGDRGRMEVTKKDADVRAFKTPSLRDVASRGPYMHDGSLPTLEAVVRHYLAGPIDDPAIDPSMPTLVATDDDVAALVELLKALSSGSRPGAAETAWPARASQASLTLVDARGRPLVGREVRLVPAGDALPGGPGAERVGKTDASGSLSYEMPLSTHVRVVVDGGLPIRGGDLVPDTCREAHLTAWVCAPVAVAIVLPAGEDAPKTLRAVHVSAPTLSIDPKPVTLLRLRSTATEAGGARVATYDGDLCEGAPQDVEIEWPGTKRVWTADLSATSVVRIDASR